MAKANKQTTETAETVVEQPRAKKTWPSMTDEQQASLDGLQTVSGKIRYLTSLGFDRGEVSRKLDIRYQHVRNVLLQPLKKAN